MTTATALSPPPLPAAACTCRGLAANEHYEGCPWLVAYKAANCITDGGPTPKLKPPKRLPYERPKGLPAPTVKKTGAPTNGGRVA
jgi:hypothetical protein